ncbi:MAG TPA: hybrid sensor histidine kinase/response regulator [Actinomycetota bacterium]|nr:hybrid sensor histidine kinase/response regulator [Actinomycetota bacterium]
MATGPLILCGLSADTAAALTEAGHEVERAADGFRALELAERTGPSGIVLRTGVPGPGPVELVARLRGSVPEAPILVILHEAGSFEAAALLRAGADGILGDDPDATYLRWALREAAEGGVVLAPPVARRLAESMAESSIREREWARSLAQFAQEAEALARAKTDFIGNLSHELRTPLTIIKGVAATLARAPASESQGQLLAEAESAADKLATMIEGILTQAEVSRGEFRLDFQPCDIVPSIREGAGEAAGHYPEIEVKVLLPPTLPGVADPRAVRGIVRQLVDNACRYSDAGGTVTVKGLRSDEGLIVHVTDRGPGFRRGQIAAAFDEAFSPGEEVMTKQLAGLGLGLNLARSLLALHGGILWAEPLPGGDGPSAQPDAPAATSTSS